MKKSIFYSVIILTTSLLLIASLDAQEHLLNYQGKITEDGAPFDGTANLTFALYDANDNQVWEEQHQSVEIQQGIFHVLLGSVDTIPEELFSEHDELYLGITVNDGAEMEPRSRITSVAYSARSNSAATVDDGAITAEKLAEDIDIVTHGTVEATSFVGDGSELTGIVAEQIAPESVGEEELADGAVTNAKVSSEANISGSKINPFFSDRFVSTNAGIRTGNLGTLINPRYHEIIFDNSENKFHFRRLIESPFILNTKIMTVDFANERVGIGVESPSYQLHLSQNSAAKPTSNVWTVDSDKRLKKNINPLANTLDNLLMLQGVTYQWIDPETQGGMDGTYPGFIAQNVEEVFPDWVSEDSDGYKQVTTIGFDALTVEAIRELREEKDAEIRELRNEVDELRSELRRLEGMLRETNVARLEN